MPNVPSVSTTDDVQVIAHFHHRERVNLTTIESTQTQLTQIKTALSIWKEQHKTTQQCKPIRLR